MVTLANSEDPDEMLACSISSESTLFAKTKDDLQRMKTILFRNNNVMTPRYPKFIVSNHFV